LPAALLAGVLFLWAPPALAAPADREAAFEAYLTIADNSSTPAGWTGAVDGCVVGVESQESINATLNTVNTLRDFAGVGPVSFDPVLNQRALAAALMTRAGNSLSHSPGISWPCYSTEGANGAASSNLYLGRSGANAMVGYVHDFGVPSLGHRRWLLNPHAGTFGTGSTGTTNALYVFGAPAAAPTVPTVLAWPPPGWVPWPLIGGAWSAAINVPGAIDASAASVQVSVGGRNTPVSGVTDLGDSYPDGHLIKWDVALAPDDRDADRTVHVAINGVKVDGVERRFSYQTHTIRADPPAATTYTASRTANSVTVSWEPAAERGVPVSGYRVQGFEDRPDQLVIDHTTGPAERHVTLPYSAPNKTLFVWVSPLSRVGSPLRGPYAVLHPPSAGVDGETTGSPTQRTGRRGSGSRTGAGLRAMVTLSRSVVKMAADGSVGIRVRCRAAGAACLGRLSLSTAGRMKLGSVRFRLRPGQTRTVRVQLSRTGRRLLTKRERLRTRAIATLRGRATTRTITLRAPKRRAARPSARAPAR
jgi:uncharacterized protein YkwD